MASQIPETTTSRTLLMEFKCNTLQIQDQPSTPVEVWFNGRQIAVSIFTRREVEMLKQRHIRMKVSQL